MPRWKKIMLALALGLLVAGTILALTESDAPASGSDAGAGGIRTGFVPGQPDPQAGPALEPLSAGFFRLGFSFFAGFCIGLAVRKLLKLVAIFVGLQLLVLFWLDWSAIAPVDWARIDALWDGFADAVAAEADGFRTFVTGRLPATGLAGLGLFAGFKKR